MAKLLIAICALVAFTQAAPLEPNPGWKVISQIILESLNQSVNPCDNFYKFSCEGYLATHKGRNVLDEMAIEANANMTNAINYIQELAAASTSKTLKTAAKLHKACIAFEGTVGGADLLNDIASEYGGWPIITPNWDISKIPNGLFHAIGDIFSAYNVPALFLPTVTTQGSSKVITIQALTAVKPNPQQDALVKEITALVKKMSPATDESTVKAQIGAIADIEIKLAQIKAKHASESDTATTSVEKAQKDYPAIQFDNLFKGFLEPVFEKDFNKFFQTILLKQPALVKDLNQYMAELESTPSTTKDAINYLIFKLLQSPTFPASFNFIQDAEQQESTNEPQASLLKNEDAPSAQFAQPSAQCDRELLSAFVGLRDRLYVEYSFPRSHRQDVNVMFDGVLAAFRKSLATLKWLDAESVNRTQKKVDTVVRKLSHPNYLTDEEKFDGLFGCLNKHVLNLKSEKPLSIYKWLKLGLCKSGQALRDLDPIVRDDFKNRPVNEINAVYFYAENLIVLPAGITHTPLYRLDFPKAINYGAAGMVIGHELNHGYDVQGVNYDHEGKRNPILTTQPKAEFDKIVQCVRTIYGRLGGTDVFDTNQNIADSAGVKASYRAFKQWESENGEEKEKLPGLEKYTWDQLFMIAQGHTWCGQAPGRVNGQFQNFDKFAEAFKCKKGDFMVPVDACDVW